MIQSEIYRGKIYANNTQLACTIVVEQTAPMQLTVRAGTFTHTDGISYLIENDAVFDLAANAFHPTEGKIEIGLVGFDGNHIGDKLYRGEVWCATRLLDGIEEFNPPADWQSVHLLAFPFVIPPGTTNLDGVDIFVLEVLPGLPSDEQMREMGIEVRADGSLRQSGRA